MLRGRISIDLLRKIWMVAISVIFLIDTASIFYSQHTKTMIFITTVALVLTNIYNLLILRITTSVKYITFYIVLLYMLFCLILPIIWGSSGLNYIYIMLILFPMIYIYVLSLKKLKLLKQFISIYVSVCVCLASISIFLWIFGSIFRILEPTGSVNFEWGDTIRNVNNYYNIYFESQNAGVDIGNLHIAVKNNAIFAEAPMSCFVFICANQLNELFLNNKKYRFILLTMIISTLTTTSQIYIIMFILYRILNWTPKYKSIIRIKVGLVCIILAVGIYLVKELMQLKSYTNSGVDRVDHIENEWKAFMSSPLFGNGFDAYTNGSSNSFFSLLADGGILLWSLFYIPVVSCLNNPNNKKFKLSALTFFIIFSFTASQYMPVTLLMIDILFVQTNYGGNYIE